MKNKNEALLNQKQRLCIILHGKSILNAPPSPINVVQMREKKNNSLMIKITSFLNDLEFYYIKDFSIAKDFWQYGQEDE